MSTNTPAKPGGFGESARSALSAWWPASRAEAIVAIFSVAVMCVVFWSWIGGRSSKPESVREVASRALAKKRSESLLKIGENPNFERDLEIAIGSDSILSAEQRKVLVATINNQIVSRCSEDPSEFVDMQSTKNTGHDWIQKLADPSDWATLESFLSQQSGAIGIPSSSISFPDVFERIAFVSWDKWKNRFVQIGNPLKGVKATGTAIPAGMQIFIYRVHSEPQVVEKLLEKIPLQDQPFWFDGQGQPALRFRVPVRPLEKVLQEEDGALVASACILAETEAGDIVNWYSHWYWDQSTSTWQCYQMYRKGPHALILF